MYICVTESLWLRNVVVRQVKSISTPQCFFFLQHTKCTFANHGIRYIVTPWILNALTRGFSRTYTQFTFYVKLRDDKLIRCSLENYHHVFARWKILKTPSEMGMMRWRWGHVKQFWNYEATSPNKATVATAHLFTTRLPAGPTSLRKLRTREFREIAKSLKNIAYQKRWISRSIFNTCWYFVRTYRVRLKKRRMWLGF